MPVNIPVNTLSGGVGRQAQSKRLPTEAEEMTNVFCTLERSVERRSGTEFVLDTGGSPVQLGDLGPNTWYHWFAISNDDRFLITMDRDKLATEEWLKIFKLNTNGALEKIDPTNITVDNDCFEYIKHENLIKDNLKAVAIGTSLLLLNTSVKAGYTSDGVDTFTFNLDGTKSESDIDVAGAGVDYRWR